MPYQVLAPYPGKNSLKVGMSGSTVERATVVTANARSLPALMCSMNAEIGAKKTCCPSATSLTRF